MMTTDDESIFDIFPYSVKDSFNNDQVWEPGFL